MPLILPGNVASATADAGYTVANSCRFNDGDSAEMTKSFGSGNQKTFTVSFWVKRGSLAETDFHILNTRASDNDRFHILFYQNDLWVINVSGGSTTLQFITDQNLEILVHG